MNSPPDLRKRSVEEILDAIELSEDQARPETARRAAPAGRILVQEFRPLAESLEWFLSERYWSREGLHPFVVGDVPYLVNNSGWASESAAAVLFASCSESSDVAGRIHILELGAGLGLFARQLLDAFRRLCSDRRRDFYDRLLYHVTDASPRTIEAWRAQDLFAGHAGHVALARRDAMRPADPVGEAGGAFESGTFQAVFANYVIDSLPVAVVRRRDEQIEQLCIRTHVSQQHADEAEQLTGLGRGEWFELAASDSGRGLDRLLPLVPFLEFEAAFRCDGASSLPHVEEVLELAGGAGRRSLNHGGIACLGECLKLLQPRGFVMLNDFGPATLETMPQLAYVSRFGKSLAASVNFPFLEHHFSARGCRVVKPTGDDERDIHSRLLTVADTPATAEGFLTSFGDDRHERAQRTATEALEHINAGRLAAALDCYKRAIACCPRDWNLLGQAAQFLCQQLLKHAEARDLARAALAINPWSSAFLWNTLGNSLFCLGETAEAHEAYLRAHAIDAADPQTNLNLAYTLALRGEHGAALAAVARGLENDADGRFQAALLRKQTEVLALLSERASILEELAGKRQAVFSAAQ